MVRGWWHREVFTGHGRAGEFLDVFEIPEGENSYTTVRRIEWKGHGMRLLVEANPASSGPLQEWEVHCAEVDGHHWGMGIAGGPAVLLSDHPFLWPHLREFHELYLHSVPTAPDRLIRRLLQVFLATVAVHPWGGRAWPPVPTGIRDLRGIDEFLSGGVGLLARGPDLLMGEYSRVLEEEKVDFHALVMGPEAEPPEERCPESTRILFVGDGYVIGNGFSANRLP